MYYTEDHEWIDFQGSVAYVGVCDFKLIGFKEIHKVVFSDMEGFKRKGDLIATITYNDYEITVNMPVDGRIVRVNEELLANNYSRFLKNAQNSAYWIVLIGPGQPYERTGLLLPEQYRKNGKSKYAKS
jgi:glycine cleavage system H protein